jgi:hypothetical protein
MLLIFRRYFFMLRPAAASAPFLPARRFTSDAPSA